MQVAGGTLTVVDGRAAMPRRQNDGHQWVGAALIPLPPTVVRAAHRRGTHRVRKEVKVIIADVYCDACRQRYDRVEGRPCSALEDKTHLIGGPLGGERKRRVVQSSAAAG